MLARPEGAPIGAYTGAVTVESGNAGGPEDVNGDGIVNVLDLLAVLAAWGLCA